MSNVEFQDESSGQYRSRVVFGQPQTPAVIRFIVKTGIVKDEKKAGVLLISLISISFLVATASIVRLSGKEEIRYNFSPEVIKALPVEAQKKIHEANK